MMFRRLENKLFCIRTPDDDEYAITAEADRTFKVYIYNYADDQTYSDPFDTLEDAMAYLIETIAHDALQETLQPQDVNDFTISLGRRLASRANFS